MAPEQALGQVDRIGEATDVHALGVILYEMLTGQAPYGHGAPAEVLLRLLREEPMPPRRIDRRVPRDLETICLKAMAKVPEARYTNVRALLEDLRRYEAGEPVLAKRPGAASRALRFLARHRVAFSTAAVVLAAVIPLVRFVVLPRVVAGQRVVQQQLLAEQRLAQQWDMAEALHGQGDHLGAVRAYAKLYSEADAAWREKIPPQMIRCARELGESDGALDAWRLVLECVPADTSFGKDDGTVADLLAGELRRKHGFLGDAAKSERNDAELALKRLDVFLAGMEGAGDLRARAKADADALRQALHPGETAVAPRGDWFLEHFELTGTEAELRKLARDKTAKAWVRGRALVALGRAQERSGDTAAARESYRRGFDLLRKSSGLYSSPRQSLEVVPQKGGFTLGKGMTKQDLIEHLFKEELVWKDDAEACVELRDAQAALRRLDPSAPDMLRGGIVLHTAGERIPKEWPVGIQVELWDAELGEQWASRGWSHDTAASLREDGTARIGVADGKYRMSVGTIYGPYPTGSKEAEANHAAWRLIAPDCEGLPKEIEVNGRWEDLPPIQLRKLTGIQLLDPPDGARVDLRTQVFHWTGVPGANSYRVRLELLEERGAGDEIRNCTGVTVAGPMVCLQELTEEQGKELEGPPVAGESPMMSESRSVGRVLEWEIEATDESGHLLGRSQKRKCCIEHGIEKGE